MSAVVRLVSVWLIYSIVYVHCRSELCLSYGYVIAKTNVHVHVIQVPKL